MYLISAYFDKEAGNTLRRHIEKTAGLTGNRFMVDNNVPPHLTIASIEARSADVLINSFSSLEGKLKSDKIMIVSTGQLLPYVFYMTPILNDYLSEMSQSVYDAFKDVPETSISKYYRPGSWLPHITIAKTLEKEQMLKALEIMQKDFAPFEARIVRLGLSSVNPHKDLKIIDL